MCLSQIDIHYSKDDKTEGIGYKVIFGNKDWFYTPIFGGCFCYDKWYNRIVYPIIIMAQQNTLNTTEQLKYDAGFHIFLNKDDCIKYCKGFMWPINFCAVSWKRYFITKVYYKGIVCKGLQNNIPCTVVKSIMIKEEDIIDKKDEKDI